MNDDLPITRRGVSGMLKILKLLLMKHLVAILDIYCTMLKILKLLLMGKSGEGVITGILWMGVVAIVSSAIAVSIWTSMGSSATSVKDLITTTIH